MLILSIRFHYKDYLSDIEEYLFYKDYLSAQTSFQHFWTWFVKTAQSFKRPSIFTITINIITILSVFMIVIFIIMNQDDIKLESCFSPRVFVNNIFEIQANYSLPETKAELKR